MTGLRSHLSGALLTPDTAHSLAGGGERWPVIDGIPYLRADSPDLARAALEPLDRGDRREALLLLLPQADPWWDGAPPSREALLELIDNVDRLSLREAMALLGYGRVGDYFAHRWSDPTFVAGLGLLDAHWTGAGTAFELACGIGHYLRQLGHLGVHATGADIVFSKLWIARHWVVLPGTSLICMDAEAAWPITGRFDVGFCHDAFYFFRDKAGVAVALRRTCDRLLISHIHNRRAANLSSAAAVDRDELTALFPGATVYGDEELTAAVVERRAPSSLTGDTEAFAIALPPSRPRCALGPCGSARPGTLLRRNPLLRPEGIAWPSDRYRAEYGARATYRADAEVPAQAIMAPEWTEAVARRELVDLPARW
jgi:hypothetical protein